MAMESFEVSEVIPAAAARIYRDWLDGEGHAAMTGAPASGSAEAGSAFTAWGGYISGETVELEAGRRILQAWRTTDFPEGSDSSRLEILLEPEGTSTRVIIRHSEIPEAVSGRYADGWFKHYFEPMKAHYGEGS